MCCRPRLARRSAVQQRFCDASQRKNLMLRGTLSQATPVGDGRPGLPLTRARVEAVETRIEIHLHHRWPKPKWVRVSRRKGQVTVSNARAISSLRRTLGALRLCSNHIVCCTSKKLSWTPRQAMKALWFIEAISLIRGVRRKERTLVITWRAGVSG